MPLAPLYINCRGIRSLIQQKLLNKINKKRYRATKASLHTSVFQNDENTNNKHLINKRKRGFTILLQNGTEILVKITD